MRSFIDCIPCMFTQAIRSAQMVGLDEAAIHELVNVVGAGLPEFDFGQSPPKNARVLYRTLAKLSGLDDPFKDAKRRHTELAKGMTPAMYEWIDTVDDKLDAATRIAAAGNILDLGATAEPEDVEGVLHRALSHEHSQWDLETLRKDLEDATSLLVVGDNAGETVFDRVMLETIASLYPRAQLYVSVRSAPIINDAILQDALAAGLDRVATIVSTGCDLPGVEIDEVSDEFRALFDTVDVVIAKGQGNFETLSEIERPLYFILTVKCRVVAEHLDLPLGSSVLLHGNCAEAPIPL